MNLLSCRNQQKAAQYERIKLIENSQITIHYPKSYDTNNQPTKTITITLKGLSNPNDTLVTITVNAENSTTKYNENEIIKENKYCNESKNTSEEKVASTIQEHYHYRCQFIAEEKLDNHHQQQHQQLHQWSCQFTVDVNLRANNHNKVNTNKINTCLSYQHRLTLTNNNNNNKNKNIMTATIKSNIITPWESSMIRTSDVTSNYMTTSTNTITVTPTWSNVYETTTTTTGGNSNTSSSNSHNNNLITSLNNLSATTNNVSSIGNDMYDNDSEMLRTIEYIGTVLSFYYVPIIVGTGSIGNILSVFVFFKTKLRKLSSSFYLAALAVSDTCFLLGLFAQWLNFVDVHIYNREYFCQFFTFFSNLACFCSVWFVVAFTVERFIAVMYPLRRQTMCTVRRAKIVLIGLTILGCLHCAPFWISSTPVYSSKLETTICDIKSEYKDYITLLNYWDTIVVFAVPFTTIAVLNTFTGCTVWKFATVRRTLTMQKLKTQHLALHGTISSPSSSCSIREISSVTTAATLANTGCTKSATAMSQQQGISTSYRITTSSLKRQKSTSCANLAHANAQHNQLVNHHHHRNHNNQHQHHNHHNHQHLSHQPDGQHVHSHPNRATTIIKQSTSGNSDIFSQKSSKRKITNSSQLKVTKMLLIVSTVFVCLNLPSFIMRMITYLETQSSTNEKTTVVLQYIFQLLFITNFGINFVLYCVSGQNFRKAVLSMFRKVSTKQRDGTTQLTVSEYYRNSGGAAAAFGTNVSTRRRMMTQNCWNEMHELQRLK